MGRYPGFVVAVLPLALEPFGIPRADPELGFFEVNGLGTGGDGPLDPFGEELAIIDAGAHVVDVAPVRDLPARTIGLRLVLVVHAVEPAVEVVLVFAP